MISQLMIAFKTRVWSNMERTVCTAFDILLPSTVCDANHKNKFVYLAPKTCKFMNFLYLYLNISLSVD